MPPPLLVWLVNPHERQGLRLHKLLQRGEGRKRPRCDFYPQTLTQCDWDVVNSRLKASGYPPWPRTFADHTKLSFMLQDQHDDGGDDWSLHNEMLFKARGRIVGGAILAIPGEATVSELQLSSAEHRTLRNATLPVLRDRLVAYKILDVFALGKFAHVDSELDANSPMLHPVLPANVASSHRAQKPMLFDITSECCQESTVQCYVLCIMYDVTHHAAIHARALDILCNTSHARTHTKSKCRTGLASTPVCKSPSRRGGPFRQCQRASWQASDGIAECHGVEHLHGGLDADAACHSESTMVSPGYIFSHDYTQEVNQNRF